MLRLSNRTEHLEKEASDLQELQQLLESDVVDFQIIPNCNTLLNNLKVVWKRVKSIEEEQNEWKKLRWTKVDTQHLQNETNKQMENVHNLPDDVFTWDVYVGLHENVSNVHAGLPLVELLANPAMRTRHWKQLVRVTGGALHVS